MCISVMWPISGTVWTMVDNKLLCLLPYVLSAVILWLGIHVFRKYSAKFAEVL